MLVLDKTGTITEGAPQVRAVAVARGVEDDVALLRIAAAVGAVGLGLVLLALRLHGLARTAGLRPTSSERWGSSGRRWVPR